MKQKTISRRAILALLGACLYQCALVGTLVNSNGVFMTAIREAAGLSMTMISTTSFIRSISGAVTASFLTVVFYRGKQRNVMAGAVVSVMLSYLLLLVGIHNIFWYLIPVLGCPVSSIGIIASPYMMQKWFPERSGTASGIAMAFSGLGGAVFNPVAAQLCTHFGWQWALVIMCALTLLMAGTGLFLLFGLGGAPESDRRTNGEASQKHDGLSIPVPVRFGLVVLAALAGITTVFASYFNLHTEELGYSLTAGATVTSFAMLGNIGGKVIFGWLMDRLGVFKTMVIASSLVAIGCGMLGLSHGLLSAMYLAALLFGASYFCNTIGLSKCCHEAYGTELRSKYTGIHVSIHGALAAVLSFGIGPVFDLCGSFTPVLVGMSAVCVVAALSALIMVGLSARKETSSVTAV